MLTIRIFPGQNTRTARLVQARRRRPRVEDLEGRQLLSTFTVTNTNNSGAGSLRAAIIASNGATGSAPNNIDFQIGSGGTETIKLKSALPAITHPVVIDGTTQPGTGSTPGIVLNGTNAGGSAVGLTLDASNSTVKGLAIDDFGGSGVAVHAGSGDLITDDFLGITPGGKAAGNGGDGVLFNNGSSDNTVGGTTFGEGNVISANQAHGVHFANATGNVVEGNLIGTNPAGTAALGNWDSGVFINSGSTNNTVGGTTTGDGNVLSGNLRGVHLGGGSSDNVIEGNLIGTNAADTAALGNRDSGVLIDGSSTNNTVGGTTTGAGNVLSGNHLRGVHISGTSSGNLVAGNLIGTNAAGTAALGNHDSGVLIDDSSTDNTVGGTTASAANTISGNKADGVHITNSAASNVVEGNLIGTNSTNTGALGNALAGVLVDGGASHNSIGGTATGAGNTISNNLNVGVNLNGAGHGNLVEADVIDSNGLSQKTSGMGNGVSIVNSAYTSIMGCTIDSNRDWGILVKSSGHSVLTSNTFLDNGLGSVKIV
jgi:parallel beta-helix repeat protein